MHTSKNLGTVFFFIPCIQINRSITYTILPIALKQAMIRTYTYSMIKSSRVTLGITLLTCGTLLALYGIYQKTHPVYQDTPKNFVTSTSEGVASTITITVPEDIDLYRTQMTEFIQIGGENPLKTTRFIEKEITIAPTDDILHASAQAAAQEIPITQDPHATQVVYLEIQDKTAYILLNIDIDGWAGVSVATGMIHPLVEQTLKQFPNIESVIFDYPPAPAWVMSLIPENENNTSETTVLRCQYKNQTVYYVTSPCCDQYNYVYDENKEALCAPDGGFTGRGDGKCSDFTTETAYCTPVTR